MASTIILSDNGASSGSAGVKTTGGNDGVLILQTTTSGGTATNALTISNAQTLGVSTTPSTWNVPAIELPDNGMVSAKGALYIQNNTYYNSGFKYTTASTANYYSLSSNGHYWGSASSGSANAAVSWTTILAVDKDKTLTLQNGVIASGTGLTFPSTQSASTDANTLDDYEEGTFTPSWVTGSGSATASGTGTYTKIGRAVTINCFFGTSSVSSPSGALRVGGLPFSVSSRGSVCVLLNGTATSITPWGEFYSGGTGIDINSWNGTGINASIANTVAAGTDIRFSFTYFTS